MAVVISAMAPPSLHGPSRLSRASSRAMPPPPLAPAKKDAQDTLFTEEEFQALISGGQCEFLSFAENNLQSSSASASPLLSIQLQAQMLCREEEEDDAYARFQEMPPSFALDGDVEERVSDEDIERIDPLFCDEELEEICAEPEQQASSMQFSTPRSDDQQAGKKRMPSPPWPSCIEDADGEGEEEDAGPPPLALPCFPPPTKKARTQTKRRGRSEHGPPPPPLSPPPPTPIKKAARTQTKSRISRRQHAGASTTQLRKWHNKIATRTLTRQFRPPELSRRRTALRCQCPELELDFGSCALHQDALPGERDWMYTADRGHGFPPLVGGPGVVLVPHTSAGSSKAMVLQYVRWRHSVSLPTRFYICAARRGDEED